MIYEVIKGYNNRPFTLTINSHTKNPVGDSIVLPTGSRLMHESTSWSGNVWFTFALNDVLMLGKCETGSIENMINAGVIKNVV
jgi:hypothetical protein